MGTNADQVETRLSVREDSPVAGTVMDVLITADAGTVGRIADLVREACAPGLHGGDLVVLQEREEARSLPSSDGTARIELVSQDLALLDVIRKHVGTVYETSPDSERASAHGTVRLVVLGETERR
ncbi:hypothetical protein [Streptacidiphilus anmyonensis]|uniref:hypothetical protein n=1 Tax=Streptacidiphilus anmyonensis TaxID=405782 RepID=UPI0005A844F9|nr:hypothetical protein [Streptacidiphilus anmyonensis]